MKTLNGRFVSAGIALGKIRYLHSAPPPVEKRGADDPAHEAERFINARRKAAEELETLSARALKEIGETGAQLFEAHQLMLEDEDFSESVLDTIRAERCCAEYAVERARDDLTEMFSQMSNAYLRERAADVRDVAARVIRILTGAPPVAELYEPCIVAADELTPSETIQLDKSMILGLVTAGGSPTSHTAILARTMGVPAVVAVGAALNADADGAFAILDGTDAKLLLHPDPETETGYKKRLAAFEERKRLLMSLRGKKTLTRDGREILIYANIAGPQDLPAVIENDAGGIGLFRTEFLYLERSDAPTEEIQLSVYRRVLEGMERKRVIFRTLDIGADKQAPCLNLAREDNPALGLRAIRLCFARPQLIKTQLRALYRASVYGKAAIMFPMIASVWEIQRIKSMIDEVQTELMNEDLAFRPDVELGIMVETPAAAILSDALAKEVDFFSIGTNDLTQYTLAADRQNAAVAEYADARHEAVLRLVELTIQNAHKNGIWCGICGEAAGDLALTERLIRMGVDELSVAPPSVLPLRDAIAKIDSGRSH